MQPERIYIFQAGSSGTFGYTLDPEGKNLPRHVAPGGWHLKNSIVPQPGEGPRVGPDIKLVQEGIRTQGFYIAAGVVTVTFGDANIISGS